MEAVRFVRDLGQKVPELVALAKTKAIIEEAFGGAAPFVQRWMLTSGRAVSFATLRRRYTVVPWCSSPHR